MMPITAFSRTCMLWLAVFTWLCVHDVAVSQPVAGQPSAVVLSEQLRHRIELAARSPSMNVQQETIRALESLVPFYEHRGFQPLWIRYGGWLPQADALVQVIRQAEHEGIKSAHPSLSRIDQLMAELRRSDAYDQAQHHPAWIELEWRLTDAFFTYGAQVLSGQIDPRELKEEWFGERSHRDLVTALQEASETDRVIDLLHNLRPSHAGYAALQKTLVLYRHLVAQGGWPSIPEGPKLQKGDRGPRVAALQHRLRLTSDLDRTRATVDDVFDTTVERALQRFQERHGLDPDGVVGTATLTALNVPAEARVRQIELNMERWRWLPQALGSRYIFVNIANFALDVVEHGQSVLTMRVIVGKPARRTPFFSADMTHLVLSPHWHVPPTIAIQDKLPLIRRDPGYVARQNFKVFRHGAGGATRVDPRAVDWSSVGARHFPYQLRQDPGPRNALGRVKFMMPNPHHVYLHDTPARELFTKDERAFSSGCIRLERPIELAEYLLRDDPQWSREKILAGSVKGIERVVHLPASIPVHLLYWTAWVDEDGVVQFRKDIYDRDKVLDQALRRGLADPRARGHVQMVMKHQ